MAVTMLSAGDLLTISGDARDNVIQVTDSGGGSLNVNGTDFSGIHKLVCNLKGGADEFRYSANGVLSLSHLDLDLGIGDDFAAVALGIVVVFARRRKRRSCAIGKPNPCRGLNALPSNLENSL